MTALGAQLSQLADRLLRWATRRADWPRGVTAAFAADDFARLARPCASLLVGAAVIAGAAVAWVLLRVLPVNAGIAALAVRVALVHVGPAAVALLLIGAVLQRQTARLWRAECRDEPAGTTALGISRERVVDQPWLAAHAAAGAAGAAVWLGLGAAVATTGAAFASAPADVGVWAAHAGFVLSAISPWDPWLAAAHGALLAATVGASALVAAGDAVPDATAPSPAGTSAVDEDDDEGPQAAVMGGALRLAFSGVAAVEALWWGFAWGLGAVA